jgi:uncharacterized membrane protein YphA (DoxX/SURF4 family)
MSTFAQHCHWLYHRTRAILCYFEGISPLLLRVFLAPIFIKAGYIKLQLGAENLGFFERLQADPSVVMWFGDTLGLPMPDLLAFMAGWIEFLGGWLLLFGLLTRLISIPLMVTMVVAATTVHWSNGWHSLPEARLTAPWEWRMDLIDDGLERKNRAVSILKNHGNYQYLTEAGSLTVLKNGIEFSAIYFIILLSLLFTGGGRYTCLDYWLFRSFRRHQCI